MKENKLVELSMDFFVDVINLVKFLNQTTKRSLPTKSAEVAPQLAQTSTKHSMHKEQGILYQNLKLR